MTLSDWDVQRHALSTIPVMALLVAYIILTSGPHNESQRLHNSEGKTCILPLSIRIVTILALVLGVEAYICGFHSNGALNILIAGFRLSLLWCFIFQITNHSWHAAAAIGTFSAMSTREPFKQSSSMRSFLHVVATLLVLGQIVSALPKQAKTKMILWVFAILPLGTFLANIFTIIAHSSSQVSQNHPIDVLIQKAKLNFDGYVQKQSKNYSAACDEYRRRYSVEPPPGFQAWYEFAKSHKSPIIDDFDLIYDGISPFWKLSGKEVLGMINDSQHFSNSELWRCTLSSHHTSKIACHHPYRSFDRHIELLFNKLLENMDVVLPRVTFLVNHFDEPSILITPRSLDNQWFNLTDMSRQKVWDSLTKYCLSSHHDQKLDTETDGVPFVTNARTSKNLCLHPEYRNMHGIAISPTSFHLIEGLVPILSTGSLSTMGHILFPSPAYIESEFRYAEEHDVDWGKKKNNLYWAGSTTGGFASDSEWKYFHRQRFVKLAQNLEKRQHSYLRKKGGKITSVKSPFLDSRLYNVGFTKIFQCKRSACRDQLAYFDVKPWADKDQALRSRLVFDIDGNGISGRYYKLLASKSTPLKHTLLREWHDDRLEPWLHYIPVSQSMEEVPELVSFLTSTTIGQRRAKEIAESGRDWFSRAFREIDLAIYTYRLLLELARLQDPERLAAS
ncbi:hypothetical protein LOZ12_001785 [Ophidiomyces ophidiicola]|uniref:Uncharacterized protein n=1 Tax=Ophidiomyces ophidiicola TaxID=1387563 RepID=A0ACB8V049_9EURO|nr:hypothetical protein LOZ61_000309 [Ophidiomyces ophidiicola]KAI1919370.1 hypothetical protein LOZ64_002293 [Ophidiomyces ophidiicola]KAI1928344.1 hypothetical protein LOZ60_002441 [Ophidiomyces ophidiicola]KAI1953598.1 hypothetical protein LOZ62_000958 [Ophidiomyces ophidiicola]KAI1968493.1 hypothetical protein LOZ59_000349 [Ophidiomyces ophidiicola]